MPEYFYCNHCKSNTLLTIRADLLITGLFLNTGIWCNMCGLMIPKRYLPKADPSVLKLIESWSEVVSNTGLAWMLPHSLRKDLSVLLSQYYNCEIPKIDQRKE